MQKIIVAPYGNIIDIFQTFVKHPCPQRIAAQGGICRIDIAGLKTKNKQMTHAEQKGDQQ